MAAVQHLPDGPHAFWLQPRGISVCGSVIVWAGTSWPEPQQQSQDIRFWSTDPGWPFTSCDNITSRHDLTYISLCHKHLIALKLSRLNHAAGVNENKNYKPDISQVYSNLYKSSFQLFILRPDGLGVLLQLVGTVSLIKPLVDLSGNLYFNLLVSVVVSDPLTSDDYKHTISANSHHHIKL